LLALREVFFGVHRFDGIARNTGAPRDVLATRLRTLVDAGVLRRERYSEHPPRDEYRLTEAGRALQPVLVSLREWGETWLPDRPYGVRFEHSCGHQLVSELVCRQCGEAVVRGSLTPHFAEGWSSNGREPATGRPSAGREAGREPYA
jgi:DNA-binding HxlR family transcriptional regulator